MEIVFSMRPLSSSAPVDVARDEHRSVERDSAENVRVEAVEDAAVAAQQRARILDLASRLSADSIRSPTCAATLVTAPDEQPLPPRDADRGKSASDAPAAAQLATKPPMRALHGLARRDRRQRRSADRDAHEHREDIGQRDQHDRRDRVRDAHLRQIAQGQEIRTEPTDVDHAEEREGAAREETLTRTEQRDRERGQQRTGQQRLLVLVLQADRREHDVARDGDRGHGKDQGLPLRAESRRVPTASPRDDQDRDREGRAPSRPSPARPRRSACR